HGRGAQPRLQRFGDCDEAVATHFRLSPKGHDRAKLRRKGVRGPRTSPPPETMPDPLSKPHVLPATCEPPVVVTESLKLAALQLASSKPALTPPGAVVARELGVHAT